MAAILSATILNTTGHRPYELPAGRWRMAQRWNDLLFAHWPIAADAMARLLPKGLEVDCFDGYAWVGVVPFWMDKVRTRAVGEGCVTVPSTGAFCELNLRTYVRSRATGMRGVYFFFAGCGECAGCSWSADAVSSAIFLGADGAEGGTGWDDWV